MAYDLEEQEQLDILRTWWQQHKNQVIAGIAIAIAAWGSYELWHRHQDQERTKAAMLYEQLIKLPEKECNKISSIANSLMKEHEDSSFATKAASLSAKACYLAQQYHQAQKQLEWALQHSDEDDPFKTIILLQLATLHLNTQHYNEALKTLSQPHDKAFDGLLADLRGDVLTAQKKFKEAKQAYQQAIVKFGTGSPYLAHIQQKIDDLGD